jgi:hypothetical protein
MCVDIDENVVLLVVFAEYIQYLVICPFRSLPVPSQAAEEID